MVAFVAIASVGRGEAFHKQLLDTRTRPRGLAQKGQARLDRRVVAEATDGYAPTQFRPSVLRNQSGDNRFQCDSVQGIARVRLLSVHFLTDYRNAVLR